MKDAMKLYGWAMAAIMLIGLTFGFLGPFLISAKDAASVIIGILCISAILPAIGYVISLVYKNPLFNKLFNGRESHEKTKRIRRSRTRPDDDSLMK